MTLLEALAPVEVLDLRGSGDTAVTRVDFDSRSVEPGSLFCCIPGADHDGHDFADAAVEGGAASLLVERPLSGPRVEAVPQVVVASVRNAVGPVAARVEGDPSREIDVVGITGTNGKTTTTYLLANIIAADGRTPHVIGTLSGARTTPEAPDLQRQLAAARDSGCTVAMEVSSHALDLHRVDGTHFAVAVFTNLTRDHLDHHGTMADYFAAKARLFTPELSASAVVCLDDEHGRRLHAAASVPTTGFCLADLEDLEVGLARSRFRWRGYAVEVPIGGRFNVMNAVAAAEAALALGIDPAVAAAGLGRPLVVPGRFEHIDAGQPFAVVVDYAHTPDGLVQVLRAADEVASQVVVVFGCGGDRDHSKRGPMGRAAVRGADVVVLTADNSRGEAVEDILAEVVAGIEDAPVAERRAVEVLVEPDRRQAIGVAIGKGGPGAVVVIAGKGHEDTITAGGSTRTFDDRVVAREELATQGWTTTTSTGEGLA